MKSLENATARPWRLGTRNGERAIYGPKGEEIAVFTGMLFNDEELANARLIASAPELLEALKALTLCPDYRGIKSHEMSRAKKLIARAEGRA